MKKIFGWKAEMFTRWSASILVIMRWAGSKNTKLEYSCKIDRAIDQKEGE